MVNLYYYLFLGSCLNYILCENNLSKTDVLATRNLSHQQKNLQKPLKIIEEITSNTLCYQRETDDSVKGPSRSVGSEVRINASGTYPVSVFISSCFKVGAPLTNEKKEHST